MDYGAEVYQQAKPADLAGRVTRYVAVGILRVVSDRSDRYRYRVVIAAGSAGLTGLALMLGALLARMLNPAGGGVSSAVIVAATVVIMAITSGLITRSVLRRRSGTAPEPRCSARRPSV